MRLLWTKIIQNTLKHRFTGRLDTLSRTLWVISGDERSCLGRFYESTDMQHDLFRSGHVLDLKPNFQNDLWRSSYSSFDASQQEKHDSDDLLAKWMSCFYLAKCYYRKTFFAKKRLNWFFLLSGGQTVDLSWNLRTCWRKSVKGNCLPSEYIYSRPGLGKCILITEVSLRKDRVPAGTRSVAKTSRWIK